VVSLLPEDLVFRLGLTRQAVVGVIVDSNRELTPENFRPNKAFVDLLHSTIATYGPELEPLREAARQQVTGWLYVIDGRTPTPTGEVPPHDICGRFDLRDGVVVQDSYERNPNHDILSENGLFRLEPTLQQRLMDAVKNR